jgi:uncharacterized membrane protein
MLDSLTFQPIFQPILMVAVVVAALALLLIGPSFANVDGRKRLTLSLIRVGIFALAFVTMLRPGCVQQIEKNQAAVLMVLIDATRSMDLPHIKDNSTRWNEVKNMVVDNESRFAELAKQKIDVKFFQFDSRSTPVEIVDGKVQLPEEPIGSETDIGSPIYDAVLGVRDRRLLAMIVASDGVQNVLDPEIELVDAVDALKDMEAPLIAVKLGLAGDAGELADVAVTSFAEQMVVNKKSDLNAKATLVARGFANQDIKVDLLISDGTTETVVASEFVRPNSAYEEMNVVLKYRPEVPGEYRITVRAEPMAGELAVRNNSLDGFLTVRDEGMRVLLLSGALGWEQKALRDSLPALDFVDLDFRPIYTPPVDRRDRVWPLEQLTDDFLDEKKFDVFILCNVDAAALWNAREKTGPLAALAEAVKNGKGLLMIGGTHSFGAGGYAETPLADVLPVKMKRGDSQPFDAEIRKELHINRPIQVKPTFDHFLTRISDSESSREAWQQLPPLVGANRLSPKQSAAVEVFLQSDDDVGHPILVSANVGGRVLVFAGDSTWRWRMAGFEKEFDQFWRQLVLWLAFWDSKNDESLTIDLPKRRFSPNARVKFGVNVRTVAGEFVAGVDFDTSLVLPDGTAEKISVAQVGEGYVCELDPKLLSQSGVYRIQVAGSHNGTKIGQGEREFVVLDRDKEKANPAANPQQMVRLASQTAEFGGKAIDPEELSAVLDEYIANPPIKKIEIPLRSRFGESILGGGSFLLAFVGLLGVEWFLRKKWGLV